MRSGVGRDLACSGLLPQILDADARLRFRGVGRRIRGPKRGKPQWSPQISNMPPVATALALGFANFCRPPLKLGLTFLKTAFNAKRLSRFGFAIIHFLPCRSGLQFDLAFACAFSIFRHHRARSDCDVARSAAMAA